MILNGSSHDLRSAGAPAVDQHDHREVRAVRASGGRIAVVGTRQPSLRDQYALSALQELVGHANGSLEIPAWIPSQVENQSLQIVAQLLEAVRNLFLSGLSKCVYPNVSNFGTNEEGERNAVMRNFIAHDGELQQLRDAFALNGDVDGGSFRAAQFLDNILDRQPVR